MKILLDQSAPRNLARVLAKHAVAHTAQLGWEEVANGKLLKLAEENGYNLLITTDQSIPYQNVMAGRLIAYQAYHWTCPGAPAQDATLSATLRSYRTQLERRSDYARHIWRTASLPFCFLGLALFITRGILQSLNHPELFINFAPTPASWPSGS